MSLSNVHAALEQAVLEPAYHDALAVVKAARNGLVYGAKIRFPHALVMSILFGRGSYADRLQFVLRATRQHATNLCKFASLYKFVTILLRRSRGGKPQGADAFLAGVVGGYAVFGERNAVNEQIVLYCVARCVSALLPRQPVAANWPADRPIPTESKTFSVFAAVVWGSVMWLFDQRRQNLQGGLVNSMDYLYVNAEKWQNLRTLIWHNK